jgi:cell division protein FtsI/penicillin-binding protein 2
VSRRTLACLVLFGLAVAACSSNQPNAGDAASSLAAALSSGKLANVSLAGTDDAAQWWQDVAGDLSEQPRNVSVGQVTTSDDTATADLHYAWRLPGGRRWSYDTTASLVRHGDDWATKADAALVAPGLKDGEHLVVRTTLAPRADIIGAGALHLVTARPVVSIGIDKTKVRAPARQAASARALAALVGVDPKPYAALVKASGPEAFVQAIVLRTRDATRSLRSGYRHIPGAVGIPGELPLAPTRDFARPILGSVGDVTAEIVKSSDGFYQAGDVAGLSGLEQRYDVQLRGTRGTVVDSIAADGAKRQLYFVEARPGEPLHITLDTRLQSLAEGLLASVKPASALVALRPSTGDMLAAASGPGGQGYSTATLGRYAPGSTFKVVSSLALLRAGLTPTSPVSCPAATVVDGKQFKNYSDYPAAHLGSIDLRTAVASSCNTAFVGQRGKVSQSALAEAAAALGFGVDHDLGYPVFLGSVPATAASPTDHAASLIGQGRVLASPVAMAAVAASVASGRAVVPRLVTDAPVVGPDPASPLTSSQAAALRSLMRSVVTSGSGVGLLDVPGRPVLAKTGTAEFGDRPPLQTHAWMIGIQDDLAVAVFVDVGASGSGTAGPILEAFLREAGRG